MLGYDSADCWSLAADFNGQNTKWNRIADMPYHRYVRSLKMDGKIPHWIYTTLEFIRKYSTLTRFTTNCMWTYVFDSKL